MKNYQSKIGNNENELRKIHLKMQQKEIQGHWRNFKNTLFEERKAIVFEKSSRNFPKNRG